MKNLNNIQKFNLKIKDYVNSKKAKNLNLNLSQERLNIVDKNQSNVQETKNLFGILTKEADLSHNPKVKALQEQLLNTKNQTEKKNFFNKTVYKLNTNPEKERLNSYNYPSNSNLLSLDEVKTRGLSLISTKTHRQIRSQFKFNSNLALNSSIAYNFFNNHPKFNINSLLNNSFLNLGNIISKPVLYVSPIKININLFYYVLESEKSINLFSESENLESLCSFLSNKFKKAVEIELIRLHHPALESQILANTIGFISNNKKVRFRSIITSLYNNTQIIKINDSKEESNLNYCKPTALIGIKVRLGGRILSQKIVPRFTTFNKQQGAFARVKSDFTTQSRFTNKSRRGAFSYTITIAHKSF